MQNSYTERREEGREGERMGKNLGTE